jgi:ABC-type polysaccharide/polyol phosphate export permease
VLPARTVFAALMPQLVGIPVLIIYSVVRFDAWFATYLLLPVAVLLQTLTMLGTAYLLAALSVFVRDTRELVMLFVMVGVFLIPAFYTPQMIDDAPPLMAWILAANPFTHFVHVYRDCLFFGTVAHPWSWAIVAGLAVAAGSCFHVFERLRVFFGNYL